MSELHELDAIEQARLLRRREVSSLELVSHHLARVDAHADELGAFVTVTADRALDEARAADDALAAGDAPVFCGVPTTIKDLTATAGIPTSMGWPCCATTSRTRTRTSSN